MTFQPRITYVCTANVCRSQLAHYLTQQRLEENPQLHLNKLGVEVSSSGVLALPGQTICDQVLPGEFITSESLSKLFNAEMIDENSLILVMEQKHQSELIKQFPRLRQQIFVLRTATEIIDKLALGIEDNSIFEAVDPEVNPGFSSPPLPDTLQERWQWMLIELDAHRGMLPFLGNIAPSERFDVPDAHDQPLTEHEYVRDLIHQSVGMLMESLEKVLGAQSMQGQSFETEGIR